MRVFFFQNHQHAMPKMLLLTDAPLFIAQTAPSPGPGSLFGGMLPIILLFAAMYFLMIAPQRKKQKAHEKMLSELASGDEVVTSGGIYGQITNVKDDRFVIRIADNTKVEVGKSFISVVVKKSGAEKS
jgi:preprotein translocase subunit YajC|uniref:preprotein translocase subunit YajC n=1 Tax=Cephaloticoccus sp. TaxID=1985742 RepID=UPI00404B6515